MSRRPQPERHHGSAPGAIAAALRREIVGGHLKPGGALQQEELAQRFHVSRIPVRDALRLLEAEGLVRIEANRGARVTELSVDEVAEIFHLRVLLECDCLEAACRLISDKDLDGIERSRRRAEIDAGTADWAEADWQFHESLYRPSRRTRQIALIGSLRAASELYAAAHDALVKEQKQWLEDHRTIVERCRERRPERAVAALRRHLLAAAALVHRHMPGQ
jgi:DNA-binding GntR family transcriptional regulator